MTYPGAGQYVFHGVALALAVRLGGGRMANIGYAPLLLGAFVLWLALALVARGRLSRFAGGPVELAFGLARRG